MIISHKEYGFFDSVLVVVGGGGSHGLIVSPKMLWSPLACLLPLKSIVRMIMLFGVWTSCLSEVSVSCAASLQQYLERAVY